MYSLDLLEYYRAAWTGELGVGLFFYLLACLFCLSVAGVLSSGFSCVDGPCNVEEVTHLFGTLAFSWAEPVQ